MQLKYDYIINLTNLQVIRAVKRYNESAKIEADILADIAKKGGADHGIVYLKEYFTHKDKEGEHMCLVFETLAQSLYDFIKANKYKGMHELRFDLVKWRKNIIQPPK